MKWALWAVAMLFLLAGSFTARPMIALICGVVFGTLIEHMRTRAERMQLFQWAQGVVGAMLEAYKSVVDLEQAQRAELEKEAAHYRRLYLQKLGAR